MGAASLHDVMSAAPGPGSSSSQMSDPVSVVRIPYRSLKRLSGGRRFEE